MGPRQNGISMSKARAQALCQIAAEAGTWRPDGMRLQPKAPVIADDFDKQTDVARRRFAPARSQARCAPVRDPLKFWAIELEQVRAAWRQKLASTTTAALWIGLRLGSLAALKDRQPAQPVEQIKETAVVGGDVVALDPLRAFRNIRQEIADLARPARVRNVNEA